MVFSFFKKPPEKMVAKPAAAPRPQTEGGAAPVEEIGTTPALEEPVNPLDFSDFHFDESPAEFHAEAEFDLIDADVEQAAVLYANGQDDTVRALLENAVRDHHFGRGERLWLMLFDLYRLGDQRPAFDALGMDFARSFEKSPPVWRNVISRISKAKAIAKLSVAGNLFFKGDLLGDNDAGFAAVRQALEKNPKLRLDLSKVKKLDASGCERLLTLLQDARKGRREVELLGRDNIGSQLEACIEAGRAERSACWLLLLELYQLQGQLDVFEEMAINYAVTFEVSPPSWDEKRVAAVEFPDAPPEALSSFSTITADQVLMGEAYFVAGDIKASRFGDLPVFAEVHDPVIVDCSAVTRIDFISTGALLNVLTTVQRTGKKIVFRHPNHLVAALFCVVGLNAVAEIVFAKY